MSDPGELGIAIQVNGAEVVIMTATHAERESGICRDLLAANPQLKIMVLSVMGGTALLYELGAKPKCIENVGAEAMLSAI